MLSTHNYIQADVAILKGKEGTEFQIIAQHDDAGDHIFISLDDTTIHGLLNDSALTKIDIQNLYNEYNIEYTNEQLSPFRSKVLDIIQELAPELHEKIIKIDKDGSQHIVAGDSLASVDCVTADGLPQIILGTDFINLSTNIQRAIIAHEIGHYALEHRIVRMTTYNENNLGGIFNATAATTSSNKLTPTGALNDAYVRTYEYEADRFAMVNTGVSYDDVQLLKSIIL